MDAMRWYSLDCRTFCGKQLLFRQSSITLTLIRTVLRTVGMAVIQKGLVLMLRVKWWVI